MGTSKMQVAGASGQAAKRTPPSSERAHRTQLLGKALTRARVVSTLFAINHWMLNWFVASMTSEADMENAALTYSTLCYRLWHWYIRARRTAWKQWRAYARRDRACNAALRELIPQVRSLRDELPRRLDLPVLDMSPEDEAIVNALRDTATKAAADREALEALVREIVRVTENSDLQRCMVDNLRSLYEYQLRTQNEYHAMVIKCLHEPSMSWKVHRRPCERKRPTRSRSSKTRRGWTATRSARKRSRQERSNERFETLATMQAARRWPGQLT